MSITNRALSLNLTNYQNQTVCLQMGLGEETLTDITDKVCTLREYSKLGIILGIALKMINIRIGDTQISSEYSSMLIVSSLVIGLATAIFALKLEKMAKNALSSSREAKASGWSKYPSNSREFDSLKASICKHVENKEIACNVNKLLDALFNHSFARPEFEESDEQLSVNMKASEQYKLIKGEEKTLYIPVSSKFRISKDGVITFGETKKSFCCDNHVPYLIQVPSNLFKLNSYWSEIIVDSEDGLQVTGPNNFGLFVEHGGGRPMVSKYKISDIS